MTKRILQRIALLLVLSILMSNTFTAFMAIEVPGLGNVAEHSTYQIANGLQYSEYTFYHNTEGVQEERIVEYQPGSTCKPAVTYNKYIYGVSSIKEEVSQLIGKGSDPVAGFNADFFMLSTGIPIGIVVTDGILRSSDAQANGIGFTADNKAFISKPGLVTTVTSNGQKCQIEYVNKNREYYCTYLFTPDFYQNTHVSKDGITIILSEVSGDLRIGQTITAKVETVYRGHVSVPLEPGKMVLSAASSHAQDKRLEFLTQGSDVTISVSAADTRWNDVVTGVGAGETILSAGAVPSGLNKSKNPRTAVGVKQDGSVVTYTVDGRQSGRSLGLSLPELGSRMASLGCVDAVNLDGGGSTTAMVRYPGDTSMVITNKPSDGSPRSCSTYLFFINTEPATHIPAILHPTPREPYIMAGAQMKFDVKATDAGYHAAPLPPGISYSVDNAEAGAFWGNTFTAGSVQTDSTVTVTGENASGSIPVHIISSPTGMGIVNQQNGAKLESLSVLVNQQFDLSAIAYFNGTKLISQDNCFTWSVEGEIGSINSDGLFTAASNLGASGKIIVTAGNLTNSIPVTILRAPVVIEDFEREKAGIIPGTDGLAFELVKDSAFASNGFGSGKLSYNFDKTQNKPVGVGANLPVEQNSSFMSLWVNGDGSGNTLTATVIAGTGTKEIEVSKLSYTGYKQVFVKLPADTKTITALGIKYNEKSPTHGTIYIDQLLGCSSNKQDQVPPTISFDTRTTAFEGNLHLIATIADDDKSVLKKDSISLKYDGNPASFDYNESTGELTAQILLGDPAYPHRATVTATDAYGNIGSGTYEYLPEILNSHFEDTKGHWSELYVEYLLGQGVFGDSLAQNANLYAPDRYITRAEFAVFMANFLKLDLSTYNSVDPPFADFAKVPIWAKASVRALYATNVVRGSSENGKLLFNPSSSISRAELMTIIGRTLPRGFKLSESKFKDAKSIPAYALSHVLTLTSIGVLSGYPDGTVKPYGNVYRGEAAKILYYVY